MGGSGATSVDVLSVLLVVVTICPWQPVLGRREQCVADPCAAGYYHCDPDTGEVFVIGNPGGDGIIPPPCETMRNITHLTWAWSDDDVARSERRLVRHSLANFPDLALLDIHGSKEVAHIGDGCFEELTNLHTLTISSPLAQEIMGSVEGSPFSGVGSLLELDLTSNELQTIAPGRLGNFTALRWLTLRGNSGVSITSLDQSGIGELSELRDLDLSFMGLDAVMNVSALANLEVLDLNHNRITDIDGVFAGLSALEILHLDQNWIESLTAASLSGLDSLEYLDVDNNRVQSISAEAFAGTPRLELLYLNNNRVRSLHPDTFSGLARLHAVYLKHNEQLVCADVEQLNLHDLAADIIHLPDHCKYTTTPAAALTTSQHNRGAASVSAPGVTWAAVCWAVISWRLLATTARARILLH